MEHVLDADFSPSLPSVRPDNLKVPIARMTVMTCYPEVHRFQQDVVLQCGGCGLTTLPTTGSSLCGHRVPSITRLMVRFSSDHHVMFGLENPSRFETCHASTTVALLGQNAPLLSSSVVGVACSKATEA